MTGEQAVRSAPADPGREGGVHADEIAFESAVAGAEAGEGSGAAVDGDAMGIDGSDVTPDGESEGASDADHFRHSYTADRATLIRRLRRIEGQVRGISRMIEREEYCIDILQQTAALRAAIESVSLLILEDHVQGCVRTAAERGEADRYVEEVLDVVRRSLGRPVRASRS